MPRAGRAPAEGGPAPGARSSRCLRPRPLAWRRLVPNFGAWAPRKGAARVGRPVLSPRPSRAAGEPTCGAGSPGTLEEGVASGRTRHRTQSAGEVADGRWGLGQEPLCPRGSLLLNSFSPPAWPQLPPALRLQALAWPQPRGPACGSTPQWPPREDPSWRTSWAPAVCNHLVRWHRRCTLQSRGPTLPGLSGAACAHPHILESPRGSRKTCHLG
nr:putative uncharacterized protein PAK6-AS1 [Symphalangus syndactylus]